MSWIATALMSLAATGPAAQEKPPDLNGVWLLNAELSDDARQKMQEAMRDRFRGRGGRRGPGGGFPGGGPGAGGFPGGGGPGRDGMPPRDGRNGNGAPDRDGDGGRRGAAFLEGYDRLTIEDGAEEIHISYGDDMRIYRTDGREVDRETARGHAKVKARWDDGRLVIESKGERLGSREVFELEAETGRLVLTQILDGRMGQVKIRRVYDRGEAEAPTPGSEARSQ